MHTKEASGMHLEVVDGSEHTLRTAQVKLPYQTTLTNYAPASKLARHDTVYAQKRSRWSTNSSNKITIMQKTHQN